MSEFAHLDGAHLATLLALALIAAIALISIVTAVANAFRPADLDTDEVADHLQKLVEHAADEYALHEETNATLERIADSLDRLDEREAGREALGPGTETPISVPTMSLPAAADVIDERVLDLFKHLND